MFWVSQNAIPTKNHLGGSFPYVFTEHGVLQLANVLRSSRSTQMSIRIIEIFVEMREALLTHKALMIEIEQIRNPATGQDEKIEKIFDYLRQLENSNTKERNNVGYKKS